MEDVMDLLNEVNQQLSEDDERDEDQVDYPLTSSPGQPTEPHVKFSTPSPSKSATSPSKRSMVCHGTGASAEALLAVYMVLWFLTVVSFSSSRLKRLHTGLRTRSPSCRCCASRSSPWRSVAHPPLVAESVCVSVCFATDKWEFILWTLLVLCVSPKSECESKSSHLYFIALYTIHIVSKLL